MSAFGFSFLLRGGRHAAGSDPQSAANTNRAARQTNSSFVLPQTDLLLLALDRQRGFFLSIVWKMYAVTSRGAVKENAMTYVARTFERS